VLPFENEREYQTIKIQQAQAERLPQLFFKAWGRYILFKSKAERDITI
jgi:hypothetical protein